MTSDPGDRSATSRPTAQEAERVARRRRRETARRHHPDLGGDTDAFVAAMQALRPPAGSAARPTGTAPVTAPITAPITVTSSVRSRATRAVLTRTTRLVRGTRGRLPRSVPGSRRWGRL